MKNLEETFNELNETVKETLERMDEETKESREELSKTVVGGFKEIHKNMENDRKPNPMSTKELNGMIEKTLSADKKEKIKVKLKVTKKE